MIFVTLDQDRTRLEQLGKLLFEAFPGSTIYQHTNPQRAPKDALSNRVSGIFLPAEMEQASGIALMQMIHRQKPDLPVFILSHSEQFHDAAMAAGAAGYLTHPINDQTLKAAILSTNSEGRMHYDD